MGKFTGDSKKLLEYVGGRENIAAVSHCVTRMRFVLNDPSKADTQAIESLACAKGTFTQAGQFQVIIGNEVSTFYTVSYTHLDVYKRQLYRHRAGFCP